MVGEVAAEQALGLPASTDLDFLGPDREPLDSPATPPPDVA
jgi:hypothetical protein